MNVRRIQRMMRRIQRMMIQTKKKKSAQINGIVARVCAAWHV
jgi:hypothetical protein